MSNGDESGLLGRLTNLQKVIVGLTGVVVAFGGLVGAVYVVKDQVFDTEKKVESTTPRLPPTSGGGGPRPVKIDVPGTKDLGPTLPLIELQGNEQKVTISATGTISDQKGHPGINIHPSGAVGEDVGQGTDPYPLPHGALVYSIGPPLPPNSVKVVGSKTTVAQPPAGTLWLGVNDARLDDNDREFAVTVKIFRNEAQTSP
jgi:hypothetical protein